MGFIIYGAIVILLLILSGIFGILSRFKTKKDLNEIKEKSYSILYEDLSVNELKQLPLKHYYFTKHWRQKKAEILKRDKYTCQICGKKYKYTRYLTVHHKTYNNIGEEKSEDLITVCKVCHKTLHRS